MTKSKIHLREDQLYRAAFTVRRRDVRRKAAIRRMLRKHGKHAAVAYNFEAGFNPQPLWEQG